MTWLPAEGKIVAPGDVLYRVDGKPTVLMNGSTPAYRTLAKSVPDGADVRELERNLRALGYDPHRKMTIDRHFTVQTAAAVRRWQKKLGVSRTGKVVLGSVVFLPGARRVGAHSLEVGDQVQRGATIMTTTSTRQVVTIDLDTSDQDLVSAGGPVTVELPDGKDVSGKISSVGKVAQTASDSSQTDAAGQGDSSQSSSATITVTVRLARRSHADLDQAPVSVELAKEERRHVPAVPVTALVALLGGGYAVEVVDADGGTHLERVKPGLYADGYVELTGRALPEGTRVVVSQ